MDTLLLALAACTASDVVSILEKMRFPVRGMTVDATAERRPEHPKRFTSVVLTYRIRAPGAPEERVRRAIDPLAGEVLLRQPLARSGHRAPL